MDAPPGNQEDVIQARVDLAAAFRLASRLKMHEGVCNHFSAMLPGKRFLINPKGMLFSRIRASSIVLMDEAGNTLEGTGRTPRTGHSIHTRVHLNHPYATVVLHLHAAIFDRHHGAGRRAARNVPPECRPLPWHHRL